VVEHADTARRDHDTAGASAHSASACFVESACFAFSHPATTSNAHNNVRIAEL
jgi:hypothetical protein